MRFGTIKELGTFFVGDDGTSYVVRSGSDLVFYDGNNPSGATLTDLLAGGGGGGAAYTAPFVDGDLVGGVLTVTHALNEQYVVVAVYDDTDSQVMPDGVVVTSTTTVDVNLGSFGTLTGTWHVVVLAKGSGGGGGGGDSYFSSTTPGSIFTSGSAAFVGAGDEWGVVDSPADKGTDVAFYVSGSGGTKDGATPGVALFGGDVVISGTLHGGSPLKIGSNMTLGTSVVTTKGFRVASPGSISDGVIVLDSAYGDLSSTFFTPGNALYVYDSNYEVWHKLVYNGSTWDGTNTIISLREGNFNFISGPAYVVGGDGYDLLTGYHPSADEVIDAGVGGKFAAGYSAAMNNGAYAQGDNAFALGAGSHAEGMGTTAIGESSHAEGTFTLARGLNSHAEGYQTLAYGDMSRATGNETVANPPFRSITGAVTGVIQLFSGQGDVTGSYGAGDNLVFASDGGTYVEGFQVVGASWDGINTYVTGNYSFSVVPGDKGRLLNASRFSASPAGYLDSAGSAEGSYTWAVSDSAHAEGNSNKTFGQNSHAEGNSNLAFGESSHAEGEHNKVVGAASHVEGGYNVAFGTRSHAEGGGSVAGGKGYGVDNVTSGVVYLSTSYGDLTSLVPWGGGGTLCVVNGTTGKSYVRPYTSFTWDGTYSQFTLVDTTLSFTPGDNVVVVVEGYEGESTADQTVGDYSHAEGGNNKALLTYAHAEGISNKVLSLAGHAEGGYNTVLSEYAHAEGQNNVAFGACSHVGGQDSYALGDHSRAAGRGVIASGSAQTVVGRYNARDNVDSLFVVGAGIGDADVDRGDILRVVCVDTASVGGNVQVTGSMFVSGSRVSIWGGTGVNVAVEPTPGAFVSVGSNAVLNYLSTATGDLGNPTEIWGVSVTSDPLSLGGQFSNYTVMATGSVDGGWTRGVRMMVPKNQNDMRFSVASYEGTLFEMSPTITSQDVMSVDDVGNLRVSGTVAVGPSSVGDVGTDVYFFVSGTMGGKDSLTPGVAVFGGDAVVSGSLYATGDIIDFGGALYVSGAVGVTGTLSVNDAVMFDSQSRVTGDIGTDVYFFVSGTMGGKDGPTPGVTVFGGDVVISGTLHGGSPLKISGGLVLTGSLIGEGSNFRINSNILQGLGEAGDQYTVSEGWSLAYGDYSHSEGSSETWADVSHAEGETSAHGQSSHAEGKNTTAGNVGYRGTCSTPGVIDLDASYNSVSIYDDLLGGGSLPAYVAVHDLTDKKSYILAASDVPPGSNWQLNLVDSAFYSSNSLIVSRWTGAPVYNPTYYAPAIRSVGGRKMHGADVVEAGTGAHAEGHDTVSFAAGSHSEGSGTIAFGVASHAQGIGTTAHGWFSHAGGSGSISIGDVSYTAGIRTIASGTAQNVIGKYNKRGNDFSLFVIGDGSDDSDENRSDLVRVNPGATPGDGRFQVTGSVQVSGSYLLNVVSGTTDPTYDVSLWDHVVVFTVNNVTGVLNPAAPVGAKVIFKDGTGAATSNGGQMLSASLGGLIDGAQTFTLPSVDYSSVSVVKINSSPETWVVV